MRDAVHHPGRYLEGLGDARILDRFPGGIVRELRVTGGTMIDRVIEDATRGTIDFEIVRHPRYRGTLLLLVAGSPDHTDRCRLAFSLDWTEAVDADPAAPVLDDEWARRLVTSGVEAARRWAEERDAPTS